MISLLRASACLVFAAAAFLQLGGTAIAVAPSPEPRTFEPDCNPCVVIVDRAAWDEPQTVIDNAAWDETVTVIDVPATTGTKIVVDAPARAVAHHDLVSAAHDVTTSTWVPQMTNQWNTTSGAWMNTFVPAVTGLLYMPFSCWWEWDDGGRYRECDGGYYYGAIITPAHYENLWHQGHYVYQLIRECDDWCDIYWGNQWYEGPFWEAVDTSHYVDTTTHYDAVYNDWIEQLPALTHIESYPIPALTHQTIVHHAALTHTALVHHDAVTHQEQAPVILSQSAQGSASGDNASVPNTTATTPVRIPVVSTITLIDKPASTRTVTITDAPAYSTQRTVVDQAAYEQAVQRPIYDVECDDNGHCHRYIDDWETIYVHHDAVTHQEAVQVPAVTHQETQTVAAVTHTETLRYDAIVGQGGSSDRGTDPLADFVLVAGLMALAGAGRYASRADELKAVVAQLAGLGDPIPPVLEPIVADDSPQTVASVEAAVSSALSAAGDAVRDPGFVDNTPPQDTPPSGRETAAARAQLDKWLSDRYAARNAPVVLPDAIWMPGPDEISDADRAAFQKAQAEFLTNTVDVPEGAIGLLVQMLAEPYIGEGQETRDVIARSRGKNPLEIMGEIGTVKREAQARAGVLGDALTVAEIAFAVAGGAEGAVKLVGVARGGLALLRDGAAALRAGDMTIDEFKALRATARAGDVGANGVLTDAEIAQRVEAIKSTEDSVARVAKAKELFQDLTDEQAWLLADDPTRAADATILSDREYRAAAKSESVARMGYGNAVERMTANRIASSSADDIFEYTAHGPRVDAGHAGNPDFIGKDAIGGTNFDITTEAARPAHEVRWYGDDLQVATYERPGGFERFPALEAAPAPAAADFEIAPIAGAGLAAANDVWDGGTTEVSPPDFTWPEPSFSDSSSGNATEASDGIEIAA